MFQEDAPLYPYFSISPYPRDPDLMPTFPHQHGDIPPDKAVRHQTGSMGGGRSRPEGDGDGSHNRNGDERVSSSKGYDLVQPSRSGSGSGSDGGRSRSSGGSGSSGVMRGHDEAREGLRRTRTEMEAANIDGDGHRNVCHVDVKGKHEREEGRPSRPGSSSSSSSFAGAAACTNNAEIKTSKSHTIVLDAAVAGDGGGDVQSSLVPSDSGGGEDDEGWGRPTKRVRQEASSP